MTPQTIVETFVDNYRSLRKDTKKMATLVADGHQMWTEFLEYVKKRCSMAAYENWLAPIKVLECNANRVFLEVPNVFVKAYLLDNYKRDLAAFLPVDSSGEPRI